MKAQKMKPAVVAAIVLLAVCGSVANGDVTAGLISHWMFDEGEGIVAQDSVGTNHGTIHGATWTTGRIGGALDFDGDLDYVEIADDDSLTPTNEITISFWLYNRGGQSVGMGKYAGCPGEPDSPGNSRAYATSVEQTTGNNAGLTIFSSTSQFDRVESSSSVPLNQWHHIAATFNRGNGAVYIDGQLDGSAAMSVSSIMNDAQPLIMGAFWDYCGTDTLHSRLNGVIDDVRIYGRALSAAEIQEVYSPQGPGVNLVVNGGFETLEITGGSWPSEYGDWSGDHSYIVSGDSGIDPCEGSQMLKFAGTAPAGSGADDMCQVYQIIDVSAYEQQIAADEALASASAYFNRVAGDANTDTEFVLDIRAFEGDPAAFPTLQEQGGMHLAGVRRSVFADGNSPTWERCEARLALPANTDYIVIGINARENVSNESTAPEFDGHFADLVSLQITTQPAAPEGIYYVDGVSGSDNNNGLSRETAFATIQRGINAAEDGNTVLVYPAVYTEEILFISKAITVEGVPERYGPPVLEAPDGYAVSFYSVEEPNSWLKNFVIRDSNLAIFIVAGSPTISNLTIVDNQFGIAAYTTAQPNISNCIFWNNANGDLEGCEANYSFLPDVNDTDELLENLVSYWTLDEGAGSIAYDSIGANHGIIQGAGWMMGRVDTGLDFYGQNDYVEIQDDDSLTPADQITISFWLYNRGGQDAGISKYAYCPSEPGSPGNSRAYGMAVDKTTGKVRLQIFASATDFDVVNGNSVVPLKEWHLITATFNQGTAKIYVDGQLDNSTTMSVSSIMNDVQPLIFGGVWDYCGPATLRRQLNGVIDEIGIWNVALSEELVERLYENDIFSGGPLFVDHRNGDYHLLSNRGRYWPEHDVWVVDKLTSPCIDGGDPAVDPSDEPMPNGGRINQGVYGGTPYASMSEWPIIADNNHDGVVDMADLALLVAKWLEKLEWAD